MMQYIRQNIKIVIGVIIIVVAAFVGTIFLVWGRGGDTGREQDIVAWVGETPIYQRDQQELYRSLLQFYQNIYKDLSAAEIERRFDLGKTALDNLINRRAVILEADARGVAVSENELKQKIFSNPAFQEEGKFNRSRYLQVIRILNQTPEQYEAGVRHDLLATKMESIVREGVKVTDEEALEEYRRTNQKISLDYLLIDIESLKAEASFTEEELGNYFEKQRQDYIQPERIQVVFISINPNKMSSGVDIGEQEIIDYYQERSSEFITPKTVRARHILFKLDQDASAQEEQKIRERAAMILEEARGGAEFSALAQEFSQDASGARGGDLGYFSRDVMVPEFAAAAFDLSVGGISDLVRTRFGYHIIKVEDIREPEEMTLEEARDKIVSRLRMENGRIRARDLADIVNEAFMDESLQEVASRHDLPIEESGFFGLDEQVPTLPLPREIREVLFGMNQGEVSEEIQWGGNRYFFQLDGRREGHLPELDEVREAVISDLLAGKARRNARDLAEESMKKINGKESLKEVAAAGSYRTGVTEPFALAGRIPELGAPAGSFKAALDLDPGETFGPVEVSQGYVVCRVVHKDPIDRAAFEEEKSRIRSKVWEEKADTFFQAWLEEIKSRMGVKLETEEARL